MSLMVTHINRRGFVLIADTNISDYKGRVVRTGSKVFEIPYLDAGLSLVGSYTVSGQPMDDWMPRLIGEYERNPTRSLAGLAEWIRGRLEHEMDHSEKADGCILHIAGFVNDSGSLHPVVYIVSNVPAIDHQTGAYLTGISTFGVNEDFWNRDCRDPTNRLQLVTGRFSWFYINGLPAGRISFLRLIDYIRSFLSEICSEDHLGFRMPRKLEEDAALIELQATVVVSMFKMSGYTDPAIGGPIERILIPWPETQRTS